MPSDLWQGFGDFVRAGVADVGNTYQEILTDSPGTGQPEPLTATFVNETVTFDPSPQAETVEPGTVPNAPDNGPIPGLDIG